MRRGCPYSPRLFTVGLDWAVRRSIAANPAFSLDLLRLSLLPLLIARTIEELLASLVTFIPALALIGMEVNFDKSEVVIRLPGRVQPQLLRPFQIGQWTFREVDHLVYLGPPGGGSPQLPSSQPSTAMGSRSAPAKSCTSCTGP